MAAITKGSFKVTTKRYGRSPWASIRGFPQFKRNMQQLSEFSDSKALTEEFVGIAREIKSDMEGRLAAKLEVPTQQYMKAKKGKALNLRKRGIVAKPFRTKGAGKSFVGINYKFAPHAHLIEFGTGERMQYKTGRRTGRLPKSGAKNRFAFFRPVVNEWGRSGKYIDRVQRALTDSIDDRVRRMPL